MQKRWRLHLLGIFLLGIFLLTVVISFSALWIISQPTVYVTATADVSFAALPTPFPSPVTANLPPESQCAQTGQAYELHLADSTEPPPAPFTQTFAAPDGQKSVYQDGDAMVVRGDQGQTWQIASLQYSPPVVHQAFWSPDSRFLLFSPAANNLPALMDTSNGKITPLLGAPEIIVFGGWSPDNNYFLIANDDEVTSSIWSTRTGTSTYTTPDKIDQTLWSPDGRWMAFTSTQYDPNRLSFTNTLTFVAADGSAQYRHILIEMSSAIKGVYTYDWHWSPDSRVLAFEDQVTNDLIYQRLLLLGTDGKVYAGASFPTAVQLFKPTNPTGTNPLLPFQWSDDSQRLTYITQQAADHFDLVGYIPSSNKTVKIVSGLFKPAFFSPSGDQLGLYTRANNLDAIHLTKPDTTDPITLVENATDAGNPDWSPDGKWVAAVWAEGKGLSHKVHLTWMHPDGTAKQDLAVNFKDVRELRWMNDGEHLAYIAWRGSAGNSIERVDLGTGQRQVLAQGLGTVTNPDYNAKTGILSFWWKTSDTTFGTDAFNSDGTRLYHVVAAGDFDLPRLEFWSPDSKMLALQLETPNNSTDYQLVLGYADGRPPVVLRVGMEILASPQWSPDSYMLSFEQVGRSDGVNPADFGLAVVNAAGQTLWYARNFPVNVPVEWSPCAT